jgi:hypothetical protein
MKAAASDEFAIWQLTTFALHRGGVQPALRFFVNHLAETGDERFRGRIHRQPRPGLNARHARHVKNQLAPTLSPPPAPLRSTNNATGYNLDAVLTTDDLVCGDNCFFAATGVTDGELLKGVRVHAGGAVTQSLVLRSHSGTMRMIEAHHRLVNLNQIYRIDYA